MLKSILIILSGFIIKKKLKSHMICHYFMVAMDFMFFSFLIFVFILIVVVILFADQRTSRTTTAASIRRTAASRAATAARTRKRTGRASGLASRQTASSVLGFGLICVFGFFKNVTLKKIKFNAS